ncbi:hypothetical protein NIES2107_33790 [Nostoc carneum NIES-2107]|nr:hypothetical protein NIES2107_33790 [Nostoc carneum NIES-2107]
MPTIMDNKDLDEKFKQLNRSPKRKEILLKLLSGETDEAIALALKIETGTVRRQISLICQLFGLKEEESYERRSRRSELISLFAKYKPELVRNKISTNFTPQVPFNSEQYIDLPQVESICHREILQPSALIRIKSPGLTGKTHLLKSILQYAQSQEYSAININFLEADQEVLSNIEALNYWFCNTVGYALFGATKMDIYWDKTLSSNMRCSVYFQDYILANLENPLVLGLDNVDHIFPYASLASDFFGLLRAWHEKGRNGNQWQNLRIILAYSTDVYIPLNINQSPFNVGQIIELPEFTKAQVQELAIRYGLNWHDKQVEKLTALVGGHPYLVQKALLHIKNQPHIKLEEVLNTAATPSGLYADHLWEIWVKLKQEPHLITAMKNLVQANQPILLNPEQVRQLNRMGLVRLSGNNVEPRCQLYRLYFRVWLN